VNGDLIFPKLCHLLVHFRAETLLKFWFVSQFHMLCFYRDALTTCTIQMNRWVVRSVQ
jgi:hypothetical protein